MINTIVTIMSVFLIYWIIGLILYLVIENAGNGGTFLFVWAFGIIGIIAIFITNTISKENIRKKKLKNKIILYDIKTNTEVYCNGIEYEDFQWYTDNSTPRQRYHRIKNYASNNEIKNMMPVTEEMKAKAKINCNNCKHNQECKELQNNNKNPLCTVDPATDFVGIFDKFEPK